MSAGPIIIPNKSVLLFLDATNILSHTTNFKMGLLSGLWTPDITTIEVWGDISAYEIANGNGYTTGGVALTSVALTRSGGTVKFTCDPAVWTASGGSIPSWRWGAVYYNGTLNGKVSPLVGYFAGEASGSPVGDVASTSSGNALTVTPNASGLISAAAA